MLWCLDSTLLLQSVLFATSVADHYVVSCCQACQSDELSIAQGEELEVIEDGDMEEWVKVGGRKLG